MSLIEIDFPSIINDATLVGTSPRSRVYRVRQNEKSYIVKCTNPVDACREEQNWSLLSQHTRNIRTPAVVQLLSRTDEGVIVYEDDFLQPIRWSKAWLKPALRQLALAHRELRELGSRSIRHEQGQSHTPGLEVILAELQPDAGEWIRRAAERFGFRHHPHHQQFDQRIERAMDRVRRWLSSDAYQQQFQLCHGDSHLGNFLWSRQKRKMYIIDWEYLHFNHLYFDLYQLLDATSPFTPLLRPVPRDEALSMYYQYCLASSGKPPLQKWSVFRNQYHAFATVYLAWTMMRVMRDAQQKQFALATLCRQYAEIMFAICSM